MRRFTPAVLATALTTLAATSAAAGIETIDCQAAQLNKAERTICRSQHLQILDAKIAEVYADKMLGRRLSADTKAALRESQYQFLARRNACGADADCLDDVMLLRSSRIHNDY